jgi:uncharacterized LabA/DUF88 family protein
MEKSIVLIDAGFLSKLSMNFGKGIYLKYNLIEFSKKLAKKQNLVCEKIYYYTAPPFLGNNPSIEEKDRYKKYLKFKDSLLKNNHVIFREGRCQRLIINGNLVFGQKGVDALVIIDLMSIPLEYKDIKKVILIANDSDFVPVVKKLKQMGIEVILYTYYSKNRESSFSRSNELLKSVSRYVQISKSDFDNSPIIKDKDNNNYKDKNKDKIKST